jgi:ribonuclease-3
MRRRSRLSARRSTTSPATSNAGDLAELIDGLPPALAETVFRHASWADDRAASYERLEFLGDSVLELAVANALYARHPDYPEGRLTKARAHVVSRATCAVVGSALGLGERLAARAPAGLEDDAKRLAVTPSVVGAVLEAALGALFLEHGFAAVEAAIVAAFSEHIETAVSSRVDPKSDLQELLARSGRRVTYTELSAEGPPHDRRFTCAAVVDGEELGRGEGRTKKDAEQEAARRALALVEATL